MPQHQLYGLRGRTWTTKYRQLYSELQRPLTKRFNDLIKTEPVDKFTPRKLGQMANEFLLPVKTLSEFLEGYELLPSGTYDRLIDRGMKVKDIGVVWGEENHE